MALGSFIDAAEHMRLVEGRRVAGLGAVTHILSLCFAPFCFSGRF
jgi:hypothetical protein